MRPKIKSPRFRHVEYCKWKWKIQLIYCSLKVVFAIWQKFSRYFPFITIKLFRFQSVYWWNEDGKIRLSLISSEWLVIFPPRAFPGLLYSLERRYCDSHRHRAVELFGEEPAKKRGIDSVLSEIQCMEGNSFMTLAVFNMIHSHTESRDSYKKSSGKWPTNVITSHTHRKIHMSRDVGQDDQW